MPQNLALSAHQIRHVLPPSLRWNLFPELSSLNVTVKDMACYRPVVLNWG